MEFLSSISYFCMSHLMNYHYKSDVQGISNQTMHHRIMPLLFVSVSITRFLVDGLVLQAHCADFHNLQT